jgi:hypothetical protein
MEQSVGSTSLPCPEIDDEVRYLVQGYSTDVLINLDLAHKISAALDIIRAQHPQFSVLRADKFYTSQVMIATNKIDDSFIKRIEKLLPKYGGKIDAIYPEQIYPSIFISLAKNIDLESFVEMYNGKGDNKYINGIACITPLLDFAPVRFKYLTDRNLFKFTFRNRRRSKEVVRFDPNKKQIVS